MVTLVESMSKLRSLLMLPCLRQIILTRSLITSNILEVLDTELETGIPANRIFCLYQLFINQSYLKKGPKASVSMISQLLGSQLVRESLKISDLT